MSHVELIDIEVRDKEALRAAALRCDLVLIDMSRYANYGKFLDDWNDPRAAYRHHIDPKDFGKCEYALVQRDSPLGKAYLAAQQEGRTLTSEQCLAINAEAKKKGTVPYEIGLVKNPRPGAVGWVPLWDRYCGGYGLAAKIGEDTGKLLQAYGVETSRRVAHQARHQIRDETTLADGSIQVRIKVPRGTVTY